MGAQARDPLMRMLNPQSILSTLTLLTHDINKLRFFIFFYFLSFSTDLQLINNKHRLTLSLKALQILAVVQVNIILKHACFALGSSMRNKKVTKSEMMDQARTKFRVYISFT